VFGSGHSTYGHIGFADEDYKGDIILCFGQNQGGTSGKLPGAEFRVKSYAVKNVVGAFRYKAWQKGYVAPTEPKPTDTGRKYGLKLDDAVKILMYLTKSITLSSAEMKKYDVDGDGRVSLNDAVWIVMDIAGV
jgi:hypothetical protein